MKHITPKTYFLASFFILFSVFYAWLRIQHTRWIHAPRSFGDTPDYFRVASEPLLSSSFWIADRAPVIPLFFKLLDKNPETIVKAQLWFSIVAWIVLAVAVALVLQNFVLKIIAFVIVLGFSLTQNIIIWDSLILSDSLALSLLALFLAACLWLIADWKWYSVLAFGILATLLAFTRDSYAFLLLMAGLTLWILILVTPYKIRVALISGILVFVFLASNVIATVGQRWYTPFLMTVGLRILPNPQYLEYFRAQGMPVSDALLQRAGKPLHADDLAILNDPALEEFRDWARKNGRRVYIKFLWHFKAETLQDPLHELEFIFNPDIYYYAATGFRQIIGSSRVNELLYPTRFGLFAFLIANFLAAALVFPAFQYRRLLWVIPLMLILFSYPQAVLIWNADANDIARHSLYHNIELRLGGWLLFFFVADFLLQKFNWVGLERLRHDTQSKNRSHDWTGFPNGRDA